MALKFGLPGRQRLSLHAPGMLESISILVCIVIRYVRMVPFYCSHVARACLHVCCPTFYRPAQTDMEAVDV